MIYLFKEKRTRMLGILMIALILFVLLALVGLGFLFVTGENPLEPFFNWAGITLNVLCIGYLVQMWISYHKETIQKEQEQGERIRTTFDERELQELEKLGIPRHLTKPFDYKKSRRKMAWMYAMAIFVNLIALGSHFLF